MNNIPLLTRFNLSPPGVRCQDGSWKLLKTNNDPKNSIVQYVHSLANSNEICDRSVIDDWSSISSKEVAVYLHSRHPDIRFLDLSECCDLTILSQIQAAGINEHHWLGHGRAGSTHFNKANARARTISEVLERTLLSECQIPLNEIWGSAVAPTAQLARQLSSLECLERWITYNAWQGMPSFQFLKIATNALASPLTEIALFEWKIYQPNIDVFVIENPYQLPVVLLKIDLIIQSKRWTFFTNGIDTSLETALEKALLESIQYIPGKDISAWHALLTESSSKVHRVSEWQSCQIISNHCPIKLCPNYTISHSLDDIMASIQGSIEVYSIPECPNVFLGYASLHNQKNWSSYTGIPIS